jgi:hypothetical protein
MLTLYLLGCKWPKGDKIHPLLSKLRHIHTELNSKVKEDAKLQAQVLWRVNSTYLPKHLLTFQCKGKKISWNI